MLLRQLFSQLYWKQGEWEQTGGCLASLYTAYWYIVKGRSNFITHNTKFTKVLFEFPYTYTYTFLQPQNFVANLSIFGQELSQIYLLYE